MIKILNCYQEKLLNVVSIFLTNYENLIKKCFLAISFIIFITISFLDSFEILDSISKRIFSNQLIGDENVFINPTSLRIDNAKPLSLFLPYKVIGYFLKNDVISVRISALFYSILTCGYLVVSARRIYIFSLLTFCFIFLKNYPILYSATDDSTVMFFLILGFHQLIIKKNNRIGLIVILIALITKDISMIYIVSFLLCVFISGIKRIIQYKKQLIIMVLALFFLHFGGYNFCWKDKGAYQAPNYAEGVSWFNVRAVSAIAHFNNKLKHHRIMPDEYFDIVKQLNIVVPKNQVDFFKHYPKEFLYDKITKFMSILIPHRVFGISFLILLLYTVLTIDLSDSQKYNFHVLNWFLIILILCIVLVVVGYFERRWIFAFEILFLMQLTKPIKRSEKLSTLFNLNIYSVLYFLTYLILVYMNRILFLS